MDNQAEWPLIVRAAQMKALPTGSPAAIEAGLCDVKGRTYTLRLSSAAAVSLSALLTYHTKTKLALTEAIPERPFRVDRFAPAVNIVVESLPRTVRDRIAAALSALTADHPNFNFAMDELGWIVLGGVDELQLTEILRRLSECLASG